MPITPTPSVVAQAESLPPLPDFADLHEAISDYSQAPVGIQKGMKRQAILAVIRMMLEDCALADRASRSQAEAAREPMTDEQAEVILNSDARWIDLVRAVELFHNIAAPLVSAGDEGQLP